MLLSTYSDKLKKQTGFILKLTPSRDSDLYILFITLNSGIINAYARGARKSKRRFAGKLTLFTENNFEISRKGTLIWIEPVQTNVTQPVFDVLTDYLLKSFFADAIIRFQPMEQREELFYRLVSNFFYLVQPQAIKQDPIFFLVSFMVKLLKQTGFLPDIGTCSSCGAKLNKSVTDSIFLSQNEGVLCPNCKTGTYVRFSGSEWHDVQLASQLSDIDKQFSHTVPIKLYRFIKLILHSKLKSWKMIEEMVLS